jgi:DNA (cytosine-5)-methyltransferase 1
MSKPRLLDLFCKAGGTTKGYQEAGFYVIGVDIESQPHYIGDEFYQADALTFPLDGYDVIHASPECKAYTNCNLSPKEKYQMLIGDIRKRLQATGKPYVIENVVGAKRHLQANLMLCGTMFDLPMERHRLFESNIFLYTPMGCNHKIAHISVTGHSIWDSRLEGTQRKDGRSRPDSIPVAIGKQAMGIDWMNKNELAQAIPPAYTKWIGLQFMDYIQQESTA